MPPTTSPTNRMRVSAVGVRSLVEGLAAGVTEPVAAASPSAILWRWWEAREAGLGERLAGGATGRGGAEAGGIVPGGGLRAGAAGGTSAAGRRPALDTAGAAAAVRAGR